MKSSTSRTCLSIHRGWTRINYLFLLCFSLLAMSVHSSASNDPSTDECSMYDSCNVSDFFRTCSCHDDCNLYGTCCKDAPNYDGKNSEEDFHCRSDRLTHPVFFKKHCPENFKGDRQVKDSCENSDSKISDLMRSAPVSSSKTMITYWNWNCAMCNEEKETDLSFWTVQALCPIGKSHDRFDVDVYRKNIAYKEDTDSWGVYEDDKFKECPISFFQPTFLSGRLRYCAPNMISHCPTGWKDEEIRNKCRVVHGERRKKGTSIYYKNVHCAMCNGVPIHNLECVGRSYKFSSFVRDNNAMKVIFNLNPSTGEHSKGQMTCFNGKRYDPFLKMCRNINCGIAESKDEGRDTCQTSSSYALLPPQSLFMIVSVTVAVLSFNVL